MRRRRAITVLLAATVGLLILGSSLPAMIHSTFFVEPPAVEPLSPPSTQSQGQSPVQNQNSTQDSAINALQNIETKGRAPKTGYARSEFGDGWAKVNGCTTREIILYRDLINTKLEDECSVTEGLLRDPYTGEDIVFSKQRSSEVQIDHVIALSDAWQKGAQLLTKQERIQLANDPIELLAVSGKENQAKSDADAATWLPKNKTFRCQYVARQISIKVKYRLWVTSAERDAMAQVLSSCPKEPLP